MRGLAGQPSQPRGSRLQRWLTRWWSCTLFDGNGRCPYLYRWQLWQRDGWGAVYVHHFVADDWSLDQHDHSSRFLSIGLRGEYTEETPSGTRTWSAPWIRTFPATHIHRVSLNTPSVWTLVYTWPRERASGFWVDGHWVLSGVYRQTARATTRASC